MVSSSTYNTSPSLASTVSTTSKNTNTTTPQHPKKLFLVVSPITTEATLYRRTASYGPVRSVHIPKDKENRRSRGIAFVAFRWHEHALSALSGLEGAVLDNLILHPRWATPRKPSPPAEQKEKTKRNGSRRKRTKPAAKNKG